MFAQILKGPEPALPKLPDLAGVEKVLAKVEQVATDFEGHISQINAGLLITGFWVGAVTILCIWFLVRRMRQRDQ